MSRRVRINYIYASLENWERFDLTCDQFGLANKNLVQQLVHAFFLEHEIFYSQAGVKDALSRDMEVEKYYRLLRDEGENSLPKYTKGRPGFGVSPLDSIDPFESGIQRTYNTITLSNYNSVLLKIARIVDTGAMVQVVSRILQCQFEECWERKYFPQIEKDQKCSLV